MRVGQQRWSASSTILSSPPDEVAKLVLALDAPALISSEPADEPQVVGVGFYGDRPSVDAGPRGGSARSARSA